MSQFVINFARVKYREHDMTSARDDSRMAVLEDEYDDDEWEVVQEIRLKRITTKMRGGGGGGGGRRRGQEEEEG